MLLVERKGVLCGAHSKFRPRFCQRAEERDMATARQESVGGILDDLAGKRLSRVNFHETDRFPLPQE